MAETVKGTGIVWGVGGITLTAGIVTANSAAKVQSFNFDRTSDKAEIKDGDGEVCGQTFYNAKRTLSLTVVPSGATISAAGLSADAWTPAPGTKITLADADGAILDADYNLVSAKLRGSNTEARMADIELERYDANDVTATIAAGP
jgi:hypothetical protein